MDVKRGQDQTSAEAKANLYRDGRHHLRSRLPAAFPVPDRSSAEGRRAHFGRAHPALSRGIGAASLTVLVVALVVLVAQLAEQITEVPVVAAIRVLHRAGPSTGLVQRGADPGHPGGRYGAGLAVAVHQAARRHGGLTARPLTARAGVVR
ncbi:hypothetical protein [[Kitasatospora] papulosa]|uniref:hypothetical protein n=1 Tax=[Kitasatospora] papulosa TaxID=1464011 RepID=UPI0036A5E6FA